MSKENLELVRRAFESFNRGDLDAALAVFERDAEWVPYLAALDEEVYRGPSEIGRHWGEILRDLPDFHIEIVQVVAASPDAVVIETEFRGMGKASGADFRTTVYQAAAFRHGKVAKAHGFRTAEEALEAVGLSE